MVFGLDIKYYFSNYTKVKMLPFLSEKVFKKFFTMASLMISPLLEHRANNRFNKFFYSVLQVIINFFLNRSCNLKTEAMLSSPPKHFKKIASARRDILQNERKFDLRLKANLYQNLAYDNILIKERLISIYKIFLRFNIGKV